MLCLQPFQWGWAAAASVCERESAGMHADHPDQADAVLAALDPGCAGPVAADTGEADHPDCRGCSGVGAALLAHNPVPVHWQAEPPSAGADPILPEPPPNALLRPPLLARS